MFFHVVCSTKNQLYLSFTLSISVSNANNIFYTYFHFDCIPEVHFCVSPKGTTSNKAPEGGMMAHLRRGVGVEHDNNNTANRTFNRWCHLLHNQLLMFFASACACLQEMMDYCTIFLFFRLLNDAAWWKIVKKKLLKNENKKNTNTLLILPKAQRLK